MTISGIILTLFTCSNCEFFIALLYALSFVLIACGSASKAIELNTVFAFITGRKCTCGKQTYYTLQDGYCTSKIASLDLIAFQLMKTHKPFRTNHLRDRHFEKSYFVWRILEWAVEVLSAAAAAAAA